MFLLSSHSVSLLLCLGVWWKWDTRSNQPLLINLLSWQSTLTSSFLNILPSVHLFSSMTAVFHNSLVFLFPFSLTGKEALTHFPSLGPSTNSAQGKVHVKQCDLLKLSRKQKRLCRREPGLAETLRDAIRLGIMECQYQFRSERWNCSLEGRTSLLKRGTR